MDADKLPPMMTPLSNIVASQNYDTKAKTTIFISNISEYTTDSFIQRMLSYCGAVVNWKRVVGPSGRLQSFGFCEYVDQESGLRAMRLLNDLKVGDKFLVVKVGSQTRALLDEYEKQHAINMKKNASGMGYQLPASVMDIHQQETDAKIMTSLQKLLDKHKDMLDGRLEDSFYLEGNLHSQLEEGQILDDDEEDDFNAAKNAKISTQSKLNNQVSDDRLKLSSKESKEAQLRKEQQYKQRLKKFYDFEDYVIKQVKQLNEKKKKSLKKLKQNAKEMRQILKEYDDDKDDEIFYDGEAWDRKLDEINKEMELDDLDEEEEKKELEAYRKRKASKKSRSDRNNSESKSHKTKPETKLENIESTNNDNSKVGLESFEVIDMEISSGNQSESDEAMFSEDDDSHNINARLLSKRRDSPNNYDAKFSDDDDTNGGESSDSDQHEKVPYNKNAAGNSKIGLQLKNTSNSNNNLTLFSDSKNTLNRSSQPEDKIQKSKIFGDDSDQEDEKKKDKKVVLTKITDAERKALPVHELPPGYDPTKLSSSEKKRYIKKIIDSIPHSKKDLYYEPLKWIYLTKRLLDVRISPWITNKIKEYIGQKDDTLVNFICDKIKARTDPYELEQALKMVLDDTSEEFTIKLWRLLIYETTAKMYGLVDY